MANSNEDRYEPYDRTFDAVEHSAAGRRAEKKRLQKVTMLIACALAILVLLSLLVLIIGSIAGSIIQDGEEQESNNPNQLPKDKITWGSVTLTAEDAKQGSLVLANNTHSYALADDDASLTDIYTYRKKLHSSGAPYQMAGMGLTDSLTEEAMTALDRFLSDCATATSNTQVLIRMAYMNKEHRQTFASSLRTNAEDYLTGYGVELRISSANGTQALTSDQAVYTWLTEHAAAYGFIVRYPADKAEATGVTDYTNYFRYVGVAHASYMKANNLCLEEYIQLLQQYNSKNRLTVTGVDGKTYDIYYAAINGTTTVSCPTNYAYTISGTNTGGVVVVIDRTSIPAPGGADTSADTTAATN